MAFRPQPFGRYELLDRISAGGMAEVFRAHDPQRNQVVALKRILPEVAEDDEFIAMFEDEARIVSTLEHPHIARALDFGQAENEWFISFEYVEGRDLRKMFNRCVERDEHPPLAVLLYIFTRIGEGLAYAHARRDSLGRPTSLVHRDVSPQNIVVSFDGDVKLIDFGIAKAQGKLTRTQAGTIKGKFGYMAPEQVRGQDVDSRADVFALGVCMWELLTLKRLFVAENELKILEKIRTMKVPAPSTENPDVPKALDEIVLRALAKNVDERYRAAKDFYREMNVFSHDFGEVATREEVAQYMRHAFPEAGKPVNDSRSNMALSKGGRRGSPPIQATEDPYRLADLSEIADDDFAQTSQLSPMQLASPKAPAVKDVKSKTDDLEVFEGLGRTGAHQSHGVTTHNTDPPHTLDQAEKEDSAVQTLMGVGAVTADVDPDGPPAPPSRGAPPPPPGRGSLPSVSQMMTAPRIVPPPAPMSAPPSARPGPAAAQQQDAPPDWDDDDVATNIVDRPSELSRRAPSTFPKGNNSTLVGVGGLGTSAPGTSAPGTLPPPVHPKPASVRPIRQQTSSSRLPNPSAPSGAGFGSVPVPAPPPPQRPPPASMRTPLPPPPTRSNAPPSVRTTTSAPPPPSVDNPFLSTLGSATNDVPRMPEELPTGPLPIIEGDGHDDPINYTNPTLAALPVSRAPSASSRMEATQMVPRSAGQNIGLWLGASIGAVVLVAASVLFVFTGPKTGRLVVNVTDARGGPVDHLEVFLDGKKTCDTAPCYVDPLSTGVHEVKVLAEGYEAPAARGTTIEARKDATVSFTLIGASPKGGTGLKIAGSQPGVKLYIDGTEIGPLPQDVRTLTAGDHKVHLAGSDRYAPLDLPLSVTKDQVQDMGTQTLKVVRGKATIISATPGSKLYIVSGSDRRELPQWPISVDIDTSKQWWLEAMKPGFDDYHQAISFDDGQAEKTFSIDLSPKGTSTATPTLALTPAPVSPTPTPVAQTSPTPAPVTTHRTHPTPATPDDGDDNGSAASGEGFLNINSVPASSVVLDGKPIGGTPQVHISVSPGAHQIVFINADQQLKKTVTVNVGAGETKVAAAKLRE